MKIAILLPDLRPGGAERVCLSLATHWLQYGLDVEFVLQQKRGDLLELLPQRGSVVSLNAPRIRNVFSPLARYLHERSPHALLAAMWPLTVIAPVAARLVNFRGRIVISEHAPLSLSFRDRGKCHRLIMIGSMRIGYRMADARVAVSSGVADDMARLSGMQRNDIAVIYNPAATGTTVRTRPVELPEGAGPLILAVGTLKPEKRFDLLVQAFARITAPNARLCILGEGPERHRLEAMAAKLGVAQRVLMPGFRIDPAPWYASADLFVLSSDHEGFGNVIVEALEHGLPVVSTDCPTGPREILQDGKYGKLVPVGDTDALARAMEEALATEHDRERLMRRARDFRIEKAANAYLDLLLPKWREGSLV